MFTRVTGFQPIVNGSESPSRISFFRKHPIEHHDLSHHQEHPQVHSRLLLKQIAGINQREHKIMIEETSLKVTGIPSDSKGQTEQIEAYIHLVPSASGSFLELLYVSRLVFLLFTK